MRELMADYKSWPEGQNLEMIEDPAGEKGLRFAPLSTYLQGSAGRLQAQLTHGPEKGRRSAGFKKKGAGPAGNMPIFAETERILRWK